MHSSTPDAEALAAVDAKIVAALERLSQALHKTLWDAAWARKLSATQAQVLLYMQAHGGDRVTITDLARRFDLSHATVSDAVRVLAAKGLLERRINAADSRSVVLRLSAQGRRMCQGLSRWAEQVRYQVATLAVSTRTQFLSTLLDLIGQLQRAGVIQVASMCTTCVHFERDRYTDATAPHHCRLMGQPLRLIDLRVDCPEHQPG